MRATIPRIFNPSRPSNTPDFATVARIIDPSARPPWRRTAERLTAEMLERLPLVHRQRILNKGYWNPALWRDAMNAVRGDQP